MTDVLDGVPDHYRFSPGGPMTSFRQIEANRQNE